MGTEGEHSVFFSCLFPGHFLHRTLSLNLGAWGSQNKDLVIEVLQKPSFRRSWNSDDFGVVICVFRRPWGEVFLTFAALETGLKIDGFSGGHRMTGSAFTAKDVAF